MTQNKDLLSSILEDYEKKEDGSDLSKSKTESDKEEITPTDTESKGEGKENPEQPTKTPKRYEGETEEEFALRQELFALKKVRDLSSEEDKSTISKRMKELRGQLKEVNKTEQKAEEKVVEDEDEEDVLVRQTLKKHKVITQDDLDRIIEERLASMTKRVSTEDSVVATQKVIDQASEMFFASRPDLMNQDDKVNDVVDAVYESIKISEKTSPRILYSQFKMFADMMYPKPKDKGNNSDDADIYNTGSSVSNIKKQTNSKNLTEEDYDEIIKSVKK